MDRKPCFYNDISRLHKIGHRYLILVFMCGYIYMSLKREVFVVVFFIPLIPLENIGSFLYNQFGSGLK